MMWSLAHIKKLKAEGHIRDYKVIGSETEVGKELAKIKKEPTGIRFIKQQLENSNIPYVTEYRFDTTRRYRFDIALPVLKIAIEYEGLVSTGKKGGHQTKKHYTKDTDKYNLAQRLGWQVHRYTTLNYQDFESDLKTIFK